MYYFKKVLFLMVELFIKKGWIDSIYLYNNTGNGHIGVFYIFMALCIINLKLRNNTFSLVYILYKFITYRFILKQILTHPNNLQIQIYYVY